MERKKIIIGSSSLVAVAVICTVSLLNRNSFNKLNIKKTATTQIATVKNVKNVSPTSTNEAVVSTSEEKTSRAEVIEEFVGPIDLNKFKKKSALDAMKWMNDRYFDQETGTTITKEKLALIRKEVAKLPKSKSMSMTEIGPDNIGGRTRAICVDKTNINRVWAGGVSGGLFVTTNGASTWSRVDSYIVAGGSANISSMTQTNDGTIYVASGSFDESWNGNGVWYSTDFGTSWTVVPGTSGLTLVNEVVSSSVSSNKTIWMATTSGIKKWTFGDAALTTVSVGAMGTCSALQISKDGSILVAAIGSNTTYVSQDGGNNWLDKGGSAAGEVPVGGIRIEYAISPSLNSSNKYSLYATRTNSSLLSMHVSHDNGTTWSQFVGASGPPPNNLNIYAEQGWYNTVVSVAPNDPERILIGGLDIWDWKQTTNNPPSGGFNHLTEWSAPPFTPIYNHADNHEMRWDANDRLYVGNDGGISITNNYGETWYPSNRGYNVAQFYGIGFDRDGAVVGGTQDNGTLYNDYSLSTNQEFREINGGDGFESEISFFNPEVVFACVYYNSIVRSGDRGASFGSFGPTFPSSYPDAGDATGGYHPFHTEFVLAENFDLNSQDSVTFMPLMNYAAGSTIRVPSMSTGDTMDYVTPVALYFDDTLYYNPSQTVVDVSVVNSINGQTVLLGNYTWTPFASASGNNPPLVGDSIMVDFPSGADTVVVGSLGTYNHYYAQNPATMELFDLGSDTVAYNVAWDLIQVQDPFQSWFVMFVNNNGGELWATRNALRLSTINEQWVKIAQGIGNGSGIDIEFSRDLNECYISAGAGVYRIDGLGDIYTSDPDFKTKAGYAGVNLDVLPTATTKTKITNTSYEGIAVNPNDATDLVLFAGFSGTNKRCDNANTATNDATLNDVALNAITSPSVACYDGIIDRDNANIIVAATSEGVFYSETGGIGAGAWLTASTGFEGTPVYEIRQSWRTWDEGNRRPGEIYAGTHGRGIWASASYLSVDENGTDLTELLKDKMIMFPNPTSDNTTLVFNLDQTSDVTVTIYNLSGSLVKTISKKNIEGGKQTLSLESADLPKGTYIVKMNAGDQNETAKFIKM